MNIDPIVTAGARAIESLAPAVTTLQAQALEWTDVAQAVERGHFTPQEDRRVQTWLARYLTARAGLLETIEDLRPIAEGGRDVDERAQLQAFLIAFTAAALLVRAGRFLVADFAADKVVQRKLNEGEPRLRVPPGQFTAVRRSLTSPANAWRLWHAMHFADERRRDLEALADDPRLAPILQHLHRAEPSMRVRLRFLVRGRLRYRIRSAWIQLDSFGQDMAGFKPWQLRINGSPATPIPPDSGS